MCDTPEFGEEQKQANELCERLRGAGGISIKDRSKFFRSYPLSFIGSELVDWLVKSGIASNRVIATRIGQRLVDHHLIHHVTDDYPFMDEKLLYRFRCDEANKKTGPSATGLIKECNGVTAFGPLVLKEKSDWKTKFCVLKANELKLYLFKAETDPSPDRTVFLDDLTVVGESKDARSSYFGFSVRSRDRTYQFCTESPKERDSWLGALTDAGAQLGTVNDDVKTVKNIFEFSCPDIDGKDLPLKNFSGQVCLIVNVACE